MTNWQTKKLGDIGRIAMCKRIMKDQTSAHGDIPFYKIGTFGKNPDAYISSELYENYKSNYSFPKIGEILISASGTIGRAVVYDGSPAYFQDSNIVWLAHDESVVLNKFLGYAYTRVNWQTDSGTIARLYNDNFRRVTIKVPEKPEQERIVGVLEVWDEYIEKLEQKIALKEQLKKGLMQQLLTGKRRLPGFNEEWQNVKLGELGSVIRGVSYNPNTDLLEDDIDSSVRLLRSNNVQKGEIVLNDVQIVSKNKVRNNQLLQKNDIVVCMANGSKRLVGKSALFNKNDDYLYTIGAFMGVYRGGGSIVSRLVKYLFATSRYEYYIASTLSGSSINNLKSSDIESMEFRVPFNSKEVLAISDVLDIAQNEVGALRLKRSKMVKQKKYLLKNLITGAIRTPEDLQPLDTSRLERSTL